MDYQLYAYFALLGTVNLIFGIRWRRLSLPERIIAVLMLVTLSAESLALYADLHCRNSFAVYHVYNPVQFFLVSAYFNRSIIFFRKHHIGLIAGGIGVLLSVLNTLFLQDIRTTNSYFLLFEGTAIIIYCLLALRQILLDEEHLPYRFALFWLTVCFLIYWSITFTEWGFLAITEEHDTAVFTIFDTLLVVANFTFYSGIGLIAGFYPHLIPSDRA